MKITSKTERVEYSSEQVFEFIRNFENFESLLPADKVENFQFSEDSCSFRIKGMADLGLKVVDEKKAELIALASDGKVPFPFTMNIFIDKENENTSMAHIEFDGDINPFMKMMVEKPLTNFFNMLVEKLAELKLD